jgi:DNA-binding protein HU-beta
VIQPRSSSIASNSASASRSFGRPAARFPARAPQFLGEPAEFHRLAEPVLHGKLQVLANQRAVEILLKRFHHRVRVDSRGALQGVDCNSPILPKPPGSPFRLTSTCGFDITRGHWCLVNKKDLVVKIASDARLTRAQASRALDAVFSGIQDSLASGNRVTISGFGSFGVSHRKARLVRNPRSGRSMEISAKRVPRFAAGPNLKTAIDGPPRLP